MTVTEAIEVDGNAPVVLYRFYDQADALLYVGVTGDPAGRFAGHARDKPWWPDVARKTAALCASREVALAHEREAIASERPLHNIRAGEIPLTLSAVPSAPPAADRGGADETPGSARAGRPAATAGPHR